MMRIWERPAAFAAAVAFANALLLASVVHAQESEPRNLGFEEPTDSGGRSPGWSFIQHAGEQSFEFAVDDQIAKDGKHSMRIKRTGPQPFGQVSQTIKADHYRGKRVRLTAFLRLDNVEAYGRRRASGAVLVLRSDGGGNRSFDDMRDRPLTGTMPWTEVSVEIDVSPTANVIDFGAGLTGSGTVWVDAVKLEVVAAEANSAPVAK